MKPWLRWLLLALAVAAMGAVGARWLKGRPSASAPAKAASAAAAEQTIEVAPRDLLRASRGVLERGIEVSGTVKAVNTAIVKAKVAAELKSLSVREGDAVRSGQVLGQLDTAEFDLRLRQAEQQADAARAQLEIAERQLTNNKALVAQGFISATALETSASNQASARANLLAAQAAADLARKSRSDATVRAPIDGLVSQRLAQPGERVALDGRLLEIVDLSRLELEAAVSPEDLATLRVGQSASLYLDGSDAAISARVARINPSAQAGSRTVSAYLALQPHPMLRQGLFARGRVEVERRSALQIPRSAVRTDQALPYAIRVAGGRTERAPLTLGQSGQAQGVEMVEINTGLSEGDSVLAASAGMVPGGVLVKVSTAGNAAPAGAAPAKAGPAQGATASAPAAAVPADMPAAASAAR